jgi:hypothetical protein
MLKAKLANLATHDQKDRQDERHVRILARCCAHYLSDACSAVRASKIPEREAVDRFMSANKVISSKRARVLDEKFDLRLGYAIPAMSSLGSLKFLPRVQAFYKHQVRAT